MKENPNISFSKTNISVIDLLNENPNLKAKEICSKLGLDFKKRGQYVNNIKSAWKKGISTSISTRTLRKDPAYVGSKVYEKPRFEGTSFEGLKAVVVAGSKVQVNFLCDRVYYEEFKKARHNRGSSVCEGLETYVIAEVEAIKKGSKAIPNLFQPIVIENLNIHRQVQRRRRIGADVRPNYVGSFGCCGALDCNVLPNYQIFVAFGVDTTIQFLCEKHFFDEVKRHNKGRVPGVSAKWFKPCGIYSFKKL